MAKPTALERKTGTSYAKEKAAIYALVADAVEVATGSRPSLEGSRLVFDLVVEEVIASAIRAGSFRFNGGHGVLETRHYPPRLKTLPSGEEVEVTPRPRVVLRPGRSTHALLESNGDLEALTAERCRPPMREVVARRGEADPD